MDLPSADVQEVPAGASPVPVSAGGICVTVGCASAGSLNTPTPFSNKDTLTGTFKTGPGVKAAAYANGKTGKSGVFVRAAAVARAASISAIDTANVTGTITPSVTGTPLDFHEIAVAFPTGGTTGVSGIEYQLIIDGVEGTATALDTATSIAITVDGATLTLALGSGKTVNNDDYLEFYAQPASQSILPSTTTRVGSSTSTFTLSGTPEDWYDAILEVVTGGTVGQPGIVVRYSLDGGYTESVKTNLTGSTLLLNDGKESSGITCTFGAGTLEKGDKVTFRTTGPEFDSASLNAALTALRASNLRWSFIHAVTTMDAALAGAFGTTMRGWAAKTKFTFGLANVRDKGKPESETDWIQRITTAWAPFADTRVAMCAGYARITCPVTGRQNRRPVSWVAVPEVARLAPQVDIGRKKNGALSSDVLIHDANAVLVEHNANLNSALHEQRFITLRTYDDEAGVYITRGNLMGPENDLQRLADRRVLNASEEVFQKAMREQIEDGFPRWPSTVKSPFNPGDIHEAWANKMEGEINSALQEQIAKTGMVSAIRVRLDRTPISIGPGQWRVEADVKITGLGYVDKFLGRIGFVDPKLDAILNKATSATA